MLEDEPGELGAGELQRVKPCGPRPDWQVSARDACVPYTHSVWEPTLD